MLIILTILQPDRNDYNNGGGRTCFADAQFWQLDAVNNYQLVARSV